MYARFTPSVINCLVCIILLTSCSSKRSFREVSFYYWKQENKVPASAIHKIKDLGVTKFYVRVMDVHWNAASQQPQPAGKSGIKPGHPALTGNTVPVIFLHNDVLLNIDSLQLPVLAKNIISAVKAFTTYTQSLSTIRHLQLDCDWTKATRNNYFQLLRLLKQELPDCSLSATIRLYPYKYPQHTGVPPVDYGVLMCYNLGRIKEAATENSVLSIAELKKYLEGKSYPLPVIPALPVFGWFVWFRNDTYKGILYNEPTWTDAPYFRKEQKNNFRLLTDTVIGNNYLRAGDLVRKEYPTDESLTAAAKLITAELKNTHEIIFFHWDDTLISQYENTIDEITDR